MNRTVLALSGAAIVVIVAVAALNFLPKQSGVGGQPSLPPSPAPTDVESRAPSVKPSTPVAAGLPEGSFLLWDTGVSMTVTIPAPAWYGEPRDGSLVKNDKSDPPDGAGMIVFAGEGDMYVYGDPCKWSSTRPETPATTVDEIVAALAAQALRDASTPVDIMLDGHAGKSMTLHVPDDANFSQCDKDSAGQGRFGSWGFGTTHLSPNRYHQGPGQIDKVWIVDVDGELVVLDIAYYAGTPKASVDEMDAIVNSISFK